MIWFFIFGEGIKVKNDFMNCENVVFYEFCLIVLNQCRESFDLRLREIKLLILVDYVGECVFEMCVWFYFGCV